jgi:hypothetical protein
LGITGVRRRDSSGDNETARFFVSNPTTYTPISTEYSPGDVYVKRAVRVDILGLSTYPRA